MFMASSGLPVGARSNRDGPRPDQGRMGNKKFFHRVIVKLSPDSGRVWWVYDLTFIAGHKYTNVGEKGLIVGEYF